MIALTLTDYMTRESPAGSRYTGQVSRTPRSVARTRWNRYDDGSRSILRRSLAERPSRGNGSLNDACFAISRLSLVMALLACCCVSGGSEPAQLLADPSFEVTKEKDQFGLVFAKWGGWKYEGDCEFRVGQVGHSR